MTGNQLRTIATETKKAKGRLRWDIRAEMRNKTIKELKAWKPTRLQDVFQGQMFEHYSHLDRLKKMYRDILLNGFYQDDMSYVNEERFDNNIEALNDGKLVQNAVYIFSLIYGEAGEDELVRYLNERHIKANAPRTPLPVWALRAYQSDIVVTTDAGDEICIELKMLSERSYLRDNKSNVWAYYVGDKGKWDEKAFSVMAVVVYLEPEQRYIWTEATLEAQKLWNNVYGSKAVPASLWKPIETLLDVLK